MHKYMFEKCSNIPPFEIRGIFLSNTEFLVPFCIPYPIYSSVNLHVNQILAIVTLHFGVSILSTSNRIPTRGQFQKRQSCILPVAIFLGKTIFSSNCTISDINVVLMSQQYNMTSQQQYHGNYQQEVNMTTCFATAPQSVFYLRY